MENRISCTLTAWDYDLSRTAAETMKFVLLTGNQLKSGGGNDPPVNVCEEISLNSRNAPGMFTRLSA